MVELSSSRKTAAEILFDVRMEQQPIDELPSDVRPATLTEAYDIQSKLNTRLSAHEFGDGVGFKIGCTTPVMQDYLGIPHPCAGKMFAETVKAEAGVFQRRKYIRPGVECEVAVRLSKDIASPIGPSPGEFVAFIDAAFASIELVDDRWCDLTAVSTPSQVADNFYNAGCVLGSAAKVDYSDLDKIKGQMTINGTVVGDGVGADILGHPLSALAWLSEHMIERGTPLKAGQVVTLGSMVKTNWIDAGDTVVVEVSGLGSCSLRLE